MRKIIALAAVALIALGYVVYLNLDDAVKTVIEKAGSEALGTKVRVGKLDVSLANKMASLSNLSIANMPGFKTDDILKTNSISVTIDDVANNTVTLKEVTISGLTVNYELNQNGANFDALQNNIKSSSSSGSSGKTSGIYVAIETLKITHAQVIPNIGGVRSPVSLPDITITNIGTKSAPATPRQVAAQIMKKVLATSSTALLKNGPPLKLPGLSADKATNALKSLLPK